MSLFTFASGYYIGKEKQPKFTKVSQNIIHKNPVKMKREEVNTELQCYYKSDFILDWNKRQEVTVTLCDRWTTVQFHEDSNWKYGVGIAIGTIAVTGVAYILNKR
jgi:hypothetical protein